MAALVQTYPQQTSGMAMLQGRTSSTSFSPQNPVRGPHTPRFSPSSSGSYRGLPSAGIVAPYAFTTTPTVSSNSSSLHNPGSPHRLQNRTFSAPNILSGNQPPMTVQTAFSGRSAFTNPSPLISSPSSSNSLPSNKDSFDDASIGTRDTSVDVPTRPKSTIGLPPSHLTQVHDSLASSKPFPERYRRVSRAPTNEFTHHGVPNRLLDHQVPDSKLLDTDGTFKTGTSSIDDLVVGKSQANPDMAQRYRRRSVGGFDNVLAASNRPSLVHSQHSSTSNGSRERPASSHTHTGSSDSAHSNHSSRSRRDQPAGFATSDSAGVAVAGPMHATAITKQEVKLVNVPPRSDASKRSNQSSPLSRPSTTPKDTIETLVTSKPNNPDTGKPNPATVGSPAVQQLTAINKDSKKSKLRRAFSFGSAAELRRASAQNTVERNAQTAKITKRNSKFEDEMDPEQAKIAQKQEAAGLGESIYSGQGHFFTGSTDNLSVQSSASSASVMLRKMGKGVKKSTRSVVGLLRPKSVVGVPAADGPVGNSAQVTVVNVEAEREKVNVNLNPHDQTGGGTGFPKLERNSIEVGSSVDNARLPVDSLSRRSLAVGEKDRAEVLAAVKKGILKRTDSNQSSPVATSNASRATDFDLPHIPRISASPDSSELSTPSEEAHPRSGHRRTDSLTLEANDTDYFSSITQYASFDGASVPLSRNISFSPRIQFHDTWPSVEYDRRGDIATCNRLTPMLAQQIKEELNTFKMEMEVHESSKVYTHFF